VEKMENQREIEEVNIYVLTKIKPPFSEVLFSFLKIKKVSLNSVLKKSDLDRRYVSKFKMKTYRPAKNTVKALSIGLRLNLEETIFFLKSAGYSLSESLVDDLVVMFCIEKEIYNIDEVNQLLYDLGFSILGTVPRE
jgi:transcriptional regulator with XRE-family HTH domain